MNSFYHSKEWTKLIQVLRNERVNSDGLVICEHCGRPIVNAYDIIAHHIIPLTEENVCDANIALNPDNIQLVHHKCHNKIHDKFGYSNREVFIVYGSPLAGKTTYVKDNMNEGDLVIDIDNIWECVSGCDRYIKPNRLKSVVFGVRDNLIEAVKYRKGKWNNAYVIGSYPFTSERDRLADMLQARLIHIDTTKEECLARLEKSQRDRVLWLEFINDYWDKVDGKF